MSQTGKSAEQTLFMGVVIQNLYDTYGYTPTFIMSSQIYLWRQLGYTVSSNWASESAIQVATQYATAHVDEYELAFAYYYRLGISQDNCVIIVRNKTPESGKLKIIKQSDF